MSRLGGSGAALAFAGSTQIGDRVGQRSLEASGRRFGPWRSEIVRDRRGALPHGARLPRGAVDLGLTLQLSIQLRPLQSRLRPASGPSTKQFAIFVSATSPAVLTRLESKSK